MSTAIVRNNISAFDYNRQSMDPLSKICLPLQQYLGIKFFRYMRIYANGHYLSLGTNLNYMQYYLENIAKLGSVFLSLVTQAPNTDYECLLWPENTQSFLFKNDNVFSALYHHDVWNGITFAKKSKKYVETWAFAGSKQDCHLIKFYINNIQVLRHFIQYFNEKASALIDCKDLKKLASFKSSIPLFQRSPVTPTCQRLQNFLANTSFGVRRKSLGNIHRCSSIDITKREQDCLSLIIKGRTTKEIARYLDISPRTVEYYINSLKNKIGCQYKTEILDWYEQSFFGNVF